MNPVPAPRVSLVGDGLHVPCLDGTERPYLSLDAAASTPAFPAVADRVAEFLPWYSSVHRGAGYKSQAATAAYEEARASFLRFAGRSGDDIAIVCRNTTEAINHLAYRLRFRPNEVVLTTVVEHHANLLPWGRVARRRYVECGPDGTFGLEDVIRGLDERPVPKLLALTGASNVTGWMPPLDDIIAAAHDRGVPVAVDAAQLAPHRPLPPEADFVSWSGHKMYAPFGAGVLVGPARVFADGDPFLAGGGAVDLVDLDEVVWTEPPDREEAGSPNVLGAVALAAAVGEYETLGWEAIAAHDAHLATALRAAVKGVPGTTVLGPERASSLPVVTFTVTGVHHALVAARLSAEHGIGVRHGCFCAHPYLVRLLGMAPAAVEQYRDEVRRGDRRAMPGAIRVSASLSATDDDVARFAAALASVVGQPAEAIYEQDPHTGDYHLASGLLPWADRGRSLGAGCARG